MMTAKIDRSQLPNPSAKPGRARRAQTALANLILEMTDIVEAQGQKRQIALQDLKSIAAGLEDLGEYTPHPLRVESMIWRAEIYFQMTTKNYARPGAKTALLNSIKELE